MRRAVLMAVTALIVAACQTPRHPTIAISPEACQSLQAWAAMGGMRERAVTWDWHHRPDVIGLRARMNVVTPADVEPDAHDLALYDALSRYTHSLDLGEFTWLAAECFDRDATVRADAYGGVRFVSAGFEHAGARVELAFEEGHCQGEQSADGAECALFRSRPET